MDDDDRSGASHFYQTPDRDSELIDPLDHMLTVGQDEEEDTIDDEDAAGISPEFQLANDVKELLQKSWQHLQNR
jgi:hypothetical protein